MSLLSSKFFEMPLTISCKALPWSNRWGLIVGVWLRYTTGVPYAVVMIWAANASAGHTKKTTVIALYHMGYGVGNIISPQLFEPRWKPRYKPTWIILLVVSKTTHILHVYQLIIISSLRFFLQLSLASFECIYGVRTSAATSLKRKMLLPGTDLWKP